MPYRAVVFGQDRAAGEAVRNINDGSEISLTVRFGERYLINRSVRQIREAMEARLG